MASAKYLRSGGPLCCRVYRCSISLCSGLGRCPPWGVDLNYIDKSVAPGTDFFVYANNGWLKTAEIPADRSYSGVNLELDKQNEAKLKGSSPSCTPDKISTNEERKLHDLYDAFTNTDAIEAAGLKHAQTDLDRLPPSRRLTISRPRWALSAWRWTGHTGFTLGIDDKHPNAYSINLYQSGLGLPDRDYYLRDDKEIAATRIAYQKYLSHMLAFTGATDANARADAIIDLEHKLAVAHWPAEDRRDADKTYNPMTISASWKSSRRNSPGASFFAAAGIPAASPRGERMVIVAEKSAFPKLAVVFAETPVAVWRDYLTIRYLHSFAAYLPKKFDDEDFAFYGTVSKGKTAAADRATRGVHLLDEQMGEALGKLYVARNTSRRKQRRKPTHSCTTCSKPMRAISRRLTG